MKFLIPISILIFAFFIGPCLGQESRSDNIRSVTKLEPFTQSLGKYKYRVSFKLVASKECESDLTFSNPKLKIAGPLSRPTLSLNVKNTGTDTYEIHRVGGVLAVSYERFDEKTKRWKHCARDSICGAGLSSSNLHIKPKKSLDVVFPVRTSREFRAKRIRCRFYMIQEDVKEGVIVTVETRLIEE